MDNAQEQLTQYLTMALERGADHAIVIETSRVATAPWVRIKCQFGCPGYGKSLCCPPNTPTPEETRKVLDSYRHAILLHRHWSKRYGIVDEFNEMVVDLETALFLDGYYKAWGMGSGPCSRCKKCNITGGCLKAHRARPAMEACGIDVFQTARTHGLPIHVIKNHREKRDSYGLVLVE